jgi:hypothetical protein
MVRHLAHHIDQFACPSRSLKKKAQHAAALTTIDLVYFGLAESCEDPGFGCALAGQSVETISNFVTLKVCAPESLDWPLDDVGDPELDALDVLEGVPCTTT